jgi:hypothetical protein
MPDKKNFLAIYTHESKAYCDAAFFERVAMTTDGIADVYIIDNSADSTYCGYLKTLFDSHGWPFHLEHIEVSRESQRDLFQRNVTDSVNRLRDIFLAGSWENFYILESDVLPMVVNWMDCLDQHKDVDVVGGIYYPGFHPIDWFHYNHCELKPTCHVLSGCTLYRRRVIERFPFRYDPANLVPFPDAWMSVDAGAAGFMLANYTGVKCQHLDDGTGTRGHNSVR